MIAAPRELHTGSRTIATPAVTLANHATAHVTEITKRRRRVTAPHATGPLRANRRLGSDPSPSRECADVSYVSVDLTHAYHQGSAARPAIRTPWA